MKTTGSRSSTLILLFLAVAVLAVVGFRYHQYVIERNFVLAVNAPCNPETESCFAWACDPEEDEECDLTPYKKVEIIANEAPQCLEEHACEEFSCDPESETCSVTYCEDETIEEWEMCVMPEEAIEEETVVLEEESTILNEEE